jgi:hypothetical protein
MSRALTKLTPRPPKELVSLFADPPLVGGESREDYEKLFSALAVAAKPADTIAWVYVRDFTDLTWEIRRERWLKQRVIETARKAEVSRLLMPPQPLSVQLRLFTSPETDADRAFRDEAAKVDKEMKRWETDPRVRQRIDKALASEGYDAAYILSQALTNSASKIDTIDKRISAYENRRNAILREIDRHSESLARRLEVSADIIDGEFTEAAE